MLTLADAVEGAIDDVVLLGMGGSSLAPEVLRQTLRRRALPRARHDAPGRDPRRCRRSSTSSARCSSRRRSRAATLETRSHTDYFWKLAPRGAQWVAITDPGLGAGEAGARSASFRAIFPGEPTIGGRYSALSPFGLVPAALLGVDLRRLLERALEMAEACRLGDGQPGARPRPLARRRLGGRPRQGLRARTRTASASGSSSSWPSRPARRARASCPRRASRPTGPTARRRRCACRSPYELGQEFFRWEFGVAVAGSILGINPFDQPNVQAAKDRTNEVLAGGDVELARRGLARRAARVGAEPATTSASRRSSTRPPAPTRRLARLADARPRGDRLRRHARLRPALPALDRASCTRAAPNTGVFIQVVDDTGEELKIPGQPFGFGRLIRAQAAGDFESLRERGRRVAPRPHGGDL